MKTSRRRRPPQGGTNPRLTTPLPVPSSPVRRTRYRLGVSRGCCFHLGETWRRRETGVVYERGISGDVGTKDFANRGGHDRRRDGTL